MVQFDSPILGDLPGLPFRSNYFDVVVSSHVLGHVPNKDKESLFAEINRVLKPGGLTAHIIETDSLHRVVKTAKKHPAVYQKQFIEQDGHIGLELAPTILKRFERNGFRLESLRLVDALVPSLQNFRKYLNHPGFENLPGVSTLRRLNKWEQRSRLVNFCYEIGMGCFHQTVEQWCGAPTNAQFIIGSWRKGG
jgi:ubiquinone/menaquinone biosynthesis C-methylase UbiE